MRSLIAQSNCSGWFEAYTTMNLLVGSPVRYRKAFKALRRSSERACRGTTQMKENKHPGISGEKKRGSALAKELQSLKCRGN